MNRTTPIQSSQHHLLAALALAVLLTFGVGESLLCIVHCQFWRVPPLSNQTAHAQHHHARRDSPLAHEAGAARIASNAPIQAAAPELACALHHGKRTNSEPVQAFPSPVHELLLALVVVVPLFLTLAWYLPALLVEPPLRWCPPPFRPPISSIL